MVEVPVTQQSSVHKNNPFLQPVAIPMTPVPLPTSAYLIILTTLLTHVYRGLFSSLREFQV